MKIEERGIDAIKPYKRNPRKNDGAVDAVAASIREFGFRVPIVIDKDGVIVCGHTRHKAAKKLGMSTIPCVMADDLTEEQLRAYRLADNKTAELSEWDAGLLDLELGEIADIDMELLGFDFQLEEGKEIGEDDSNEEYQNFVDKFKPKLTTDDCYTPESVYEAVKTWAIEAYGLHEWEIVRPFWPGRDYKNYGYPERCVVIDNPPFSIASEICKYYIERDIKFFLFANHLTLFSKTNKLNYIACKAQVIYENGANVATSFHTNLGDYLIDTAPSLYAAIDAAQPKVTADLTRYDWPEELCTAALIGTLAENGIELKIRHREAVQISNLDKAREIDRSVFGGGFLLCRSAAAAKAAAKAAVAAKPRIKIELSEREREIVEKMG